MANATSTCNIYRQIEMWTIGEIIDVKSTAYIIDIINFRVPQAPGGPPCMECDYKKGYDINDPTVYILLIKYKLYKTIYIIINSMNRTICPSNN